MNKRAPLNLVIVLVGLALAACAPSAPVGARHASPASGAGDAQVAQANPNRTMTIILRAEPKALNTKLGAVTVAAALQGGVPRLFNAYLAINDEREVPHPYLVEQLPQLNTDSWRVFPDGRMETTYRLRPNLTWPDGAPLTAQDFVFGLRVITDPQVGPMLFKVTAEPYIDEFIAADERTIVIRWKSPYLDGGALGGEWALPRHFLGEPFQRGNPEAFGALPFWGREYMGLGPYRLDQWEPGAFIEGVAFSGHALGPPKIPRVRIIFAGDANAALTYLLAGAADFVESITLALQFQQGLTLKREWGGTVLLEPSQVRYIQVQQRPEYANPREILDLRVRKALLHATDRQALIDGLLEGYGQITHAMISPLVSYYQDVDRAVAKYPYDLRRTEQLMAEAGFTKGPDGFYVTPTGTQFTPQLRTTSGSSGSQDELEQAVLVDLWRRAGVAVQPAVLPIAQANDGEKISTFPAFVNGSSAIGATLVKFRTDYIASAQKSWTGSNRGGYSDPEYDRLALLADKTLDRNEREQFVVQMMKVVSETVGGLPLYYSTGVSAYAAGLYGPVPGGSMWNVQEWEWR
jgi:peptide/nickel transport system substrate-binding protein